ncbi:hypothetical protein HL666_00190 [Bradyrhizobium sp. 83002]|nr:hypothetical protein [Bradyrhizobium aeschynomenes]
MIHKDADSHFGMSFPDLPGVVTAATSLDDARIMAEEALALHIEGVIADGKAIPGPSSLEWIMADVDNRPGVAVLIAATVDQPKAVRVNVTLPEDALVLRKTIRQIRLLFHFFGNPVYLSPVLLPPEGRVATVTRRGRWDAMGAATRSVASCRADERFVAHGEIVRS